MAFAALLLLGLLGGALAQTPLHGLLLSGALLFSLWWLRRRHRWSAVRLGLALLLALSAAVRGALGSRPAPGALDPVHAITERHQSGRQQSEAERSLVGRWIQDAPVRAGRCQGLLAVQSLDGRRALGLTQISVAPCAKPLRVGGWVAVRGVLQRPTPAPHPLLQGAAERLASQGSWSQLRASELQPLRQEWTPLADLRRRIASQLQRSAGPGPGGLMAALVLGGAQVELAADLREAFRAAGLSHALAASGFHLSVLLGSTMTLARRWPAPLRLAAGGVAMALFLALAGAQASVVRAVLMGAAALLIRERGGRSRPLQVLLITLVLMLVVHPAWAHGIGFQLSAAATAGLIVLAGPIERRLAGRMPQRLAALLSVPLAASLATLPLQLLHFGVVPSYGVLANALAAPLLTPLTLGAMAMAVLAVFCAPLLPWAALLLVPLAQLLMLLVQAVSALPWAQLPLGQLSPWLLALLLMGFGLWGRWRWVSLLTLLLGFGLRWLEVQRDQLLLVHQEERQWLLSRHQGRGALVSLKADPISCRQARRLATGLGVARFDWVLLLDPVPAKEPACWSALSASVVPHGRLLPGRRLQSPGLTVQALAADSRGLRLQVGQARWVLLPDRQAWWSWTRQPKEPVRGVWLGFAPSRRERRQLEASAARGDWWPQAGSGSGWHQS
ncbi:MAG: ComEC/Rec2 family competence protein [Vulcanococcus sp.]